MIVLLAAAALGLAQHSVRTDHTWTCRQKVDLDLVQVTIPRGKREDAVHLRFGCTGRIGRLVVVQRSGDGVKVAEGVHDLVVGGGSIRCLSKAPHFHQDGIQVMGGARITFRDLNVSCGRRDERLINSNFFINQGRHSRLPPRDVVCESCSFGGWAAHTVSVQASERSGVTGSTLCVARFPQFTLAVGDDALHPRVHDNRVHQCSSGELTLERGPRTVEFGEPLKLRGLFLGQLPGTRVVAEAVGGSPKVVRLDATHSKRNGRFRLTLRPRVGELVRLRSGSLHGPSFHVLVRPRIVLRRRGSTLVVRVRAGRSYAGRTAVLQVRRHGRWVVVQRIELRRRSRARFQPTVHGTRVRIAVARRPGYLAAHSDTLRLP
ncbi:MAG TPA: hypothetical protein VLK24_04865 [Gaiellaceae bacterium]|nr:hypothetical protein [Gaiellaceae bacterium]